MVREVKGKNTEQPREKSRLVVQGHNDHEKRFILTQSPTIQRCSQRLLIALAPTLVKEYGMTLALRDITQAYTQSHTPLNREFWCSIPTELKKKFPEGTILRVVLPLYGIPESGAHWFVTYAKHHREKLNMKPSTFDPCLMITKKSNDDDFGMAALQTDDTLQLSTLAFMEKEERELTFKAKPKTILGDGSMEDFNGCRIRINGSILTVTQKGQAEKLTIVDIKAANRDQQYVEQRARGAYIASIC